MGFSRQEYWDGSPFPSPGALADPGIEPMSPALQADSLPSEPQGMQELQETQVQSLGGEDPLEKKMATHSSILAWRIPWTEEPGGVQAKGHKESDMTEHALNFRVCLRLISTPLTLPRSRPILHYLYNPFLASKDSPL